MLDYIRSLFNREPEKDELQQIFAEIDDCMKDFEHKLDLSNKLQAQADNADSLDLPVNEKIARKHFYLNSAQDNLRKAEMCNMRIDELKARILTIIEDKRC